MSFCCESQISAKCGAATMPAAHLSILSMTRPSTSTHSFVPLRLTGRRGMLCQHVRIQSAMYTGFGVWGIGCRSGMQHLAPCARVVGEDLAEFVAQIAAAACGTRGENYRQGMAFAAAKSHKHRVLGHVQTCGIISAHAQRLILKNTSACNAMQGGRTLCH